MTTRDEALEFIGRLERVDFQIGDGQRMAMLASLREYVNARPTDVALLWQCSQCAESYDDSGHECAEEPPVEESPIYIAPWERAILGHPDAPEEDEAYMREVAEDDLAREATMRETEEEPRADD